MSSSINSEDNKAVAVGFLSLGTVDSNVDLPSYVQEHNTELTFPEKLMLLLTHVETVCARKGVRESDESIGWVLDGRAFVIRNKDKLCKTWVPLFFGHSKFSSFTRKLYRWGFRKANLAQEGLSPTSYYFGNEYFQRDNKALLSRMRSITAAKTRTEMAAQNASNTIVMPPAGLAGYPAHVAFQMNALQQGPGFLNFQLPSALSQPYLQNLQQAQQLDPATLHHVITLAQVALQQQIQQQPSESNELQAQADASADHFVPDLMHLAMSQYQPLNQIILQPPITYSSDNHPYTLIPVQLPQTQLPTQSQAVANTNANTSKKNIRKLKSPEKVE